MILITDVRLVSHFQRMSDTVSLTVNIPGFDYLDFVLLGFSSSMVSKIVNLGTDEPSNYRNKMNTDFAIWNKKTQHRKHYQILDINYNDIFPATLSNFQVYAS